ncbi:MAG TPA: hypothetical protein VN363_07465 [Anaerolineales bacterium]|nr:hypothetical protein [Anaerolineales bacterium]
MSSRITCPMCGFEYDPASQVVCQGCPLQRGCGLVRCPNCGFETPDLQHSKLAGWAARLFKEPILIPGRQKLSGKAKL